LEEVWLWALGFAFGKKKGDWLSDLCVYVSFCGHAGAGTTGSISITETTTDVLPSTGLSKSVGGFATGGVLGDFTVGMQKDIDNPDNVSTSVGLGVGAGVFVGTLTCGTAQACVIN
jgi:hypothetical protein